MRALAILAAVVGLSACGMSLQAQCGLGAQLALVLTGENYTEVCAIIPPDVVITLPEKDGLPVVPEAMVAE